VCVAKVVDILDIKWESLFSADKPRPVLPGSALRRFATHRILHDIGVSAAFAGDGLVQKLKSVCQQQMDDDASSLAAAAGKWWSVTRKPSLEVTPTTLATLFLLWLWTLTFELEHTYLLLPE